MGESSTFSARGVEEIQARGRAVIDVRAQWPTRQELLGGEPGPVRGVGTPLDRPVTAIVRGPSGEISLEVTTIQLFVGVDETLSVAGFTRSFTDHAATAAELARTADLVVLPEAGVAAAARRLRAGDPKRRDRDTLNSGLALGVCVDVTVHRLPPRGDVPAIDVLDWSITPVGGAATSDPLAPDGGD